MVGFRVNITKIFILINDKSRKIVTPGKIFYSSNNNYVNGNFKGPSIPTNLHEKSPLFKRILWVVS